ncbi:MAG TPA: hypothetical protein VGK25_14335 [Ignavibacteria bacterium]
MANTVFYHKDFYKTLQNWTKHKSSKVMRAVVISTTGLRDKENLQKGFTLLEPLMYDSAVYVKKNLGPFVLGSYFGNAFPEETLRQLNKWSKIKNEHVRWNIAIAFNCSFGNKYPDKALKYLKILSNDPSIIAQRGVKSTVNFLKKGILT